MNFLRISTVAFAFLLSPSVFATTPECDYWRAQLPDLSDRLDVANAELAECRITDPDNCTTLELLVTGLEMQKSAVEGFIKDFCE